jgi:diamine N-acetyltransferase
MDKYTMQTIHFKKLDASNAVELQQMAIQTFKETFEAVNTPENMDLYIANAMSLTVLEAELSKSEAVFYFILVDNEPAGYCKLNFNAAQTELKKAETSELERIYVLKAFQGKQLGKLLMDKAIATAKKHYKKLLWLGVWEHNNKAINFYKKLGFTVFGSHDFYLGTDRQTDLLMELKLG